MTLSQDLAQAAAIFEGWTSTEVRPPNAGGWQAPAKTGDRVAPAAWLAHALSYTASELASFAGGAVREGLLEAVLFIEPGVGEGRARELLDELEALLIAPTSSTPSFTLLAPQPAPGETVLVDDEDWEAWPVVTPFVAQN